MGTTRKVGRVPGGGCWADRSVENGESTASSRLVSTRSHAPAVGRQPTSHSVQAASRTAVSYDRNGTLSGSKESKDKVGDNGSTRQRKQCGLTSASPSVAPLPAWPASWSQYSTCP